MAPDHQPPLRLPTPRRWRRIRLAMLVTYAALVIASNLWVARSPSTVAPSPRSVRTPAGAERTAREVTISTSPGDTLDVRISSLHWPVTGRGSTSSPAPLPVILLHGGPGQARDFAPLAELLRARRDVYALDLLGFGDSEPLVPDYSLRRNAEAAARWMDRAGIRRAHVLGWSQGGGVALHLADSPTNPFTLRPDTIASIALAGSIAAQETEGSRSYRFEHARYALGDAARIVLPRLIPHFGLLPRIPPAFTRFFSDSDQRELSALLPRITTPVLVLHGRRDFLIPAWAAERHFELIPTASLAMFPGSHFVPFWPPAERRLAADTLEAFFARHDAPRALHPASPAAPPAPRRERIEFGEPPPRLFGTPGARAADAFIALPWWAITAAMLMLSARRGPGARWPAAIGACLIVTGLADYAVIALGLILGAWAWLIRRARAGDAGARAPAESHLNEWRERLARGPVWAIATAIFRPPLPGHPGGLRDEIGIALRAAAPVARPWLALAAAAALAAQQLLVLIAAIIPAAVIMQDPAHPLGEPGIALALIAARLAAGLADHAPTRPGRIALRARLARMTRFEFWPTWAIYLGMLDLFIRETLRTRHPLMFTACNPGIDAGGGVVGESKFDIMDHLRRDARAAGVDDELVRAVCRTWRIPPPAAGSPRDRLIHLDRLIAAAPGTLNYPLVLKPERGYRGTAVRIARTREDAARAFDIVPPAAAMLIQPWHPGPGEVGIVWMRTTSATPPSTAPSSPHPVLLTGRIYSITLKRFPRALGDGRHTVEQLILRHPRTRLQAGAFLARLAGLRLHVPAAGRPIALGLAGNHCQGALFEDGGRLITPALERAIDALCGAYRGQAQGGGKGGGLDMVRLDIRFRAEHDLRAGRLDPDSIVELNGTLGETTNIYDPGRSIAWSYGQLRGQWRALYRLGHRRASASPPHPPHRPMSIAMLLRTLIRSARARTGPSLSD